MITVYAIKPDNPELFKQTCKVFDCVFVKIDSIREIDTDREIIIFHPKKNNNEDWIKIENLKDFDHPDNAYYVFGSDYGSITYDIQKNNPEIKDKVRFVRIESYNPLHASISCGIVLYDRFMKIN